MKFSGRAKFLILLSTEWPSLQLIKTISKGGTYNENTDRENSERD